MPCGRQRTEGPGPGHSSRRNAALPEPPRRGRAPAGVCQAWYQLHARGIPPLGHVVPLRRSPRTCPSLPGRRCARAAFAEAGRDSARRASWTVPRTGCGECRDWVRGVPAVKITPHAMKTRRRRAPFWAAQTCGAVGGERGRGTGERGRGERSASEEVTGTPSPESPAVLGPAPGLCSAVGCSLDVTYLGRKRDFSPQSSGVAAPVELMQGLLRTVRTVPERWAGRGQSGRLVWLAAVLAAGSGPGSLRAGKSSRRQGGIGGM